MDGLAALQEFSTVSPAAVGRVGERDTRGITGIPCIFGLARLLLSSLGGEGRKRRSVHGLVLNDGFSWCHTRAMLTNSARCSGDVIKSASRKHACAWWRYAAAYGACARTTT
jgi:hypothetical protein